MKSDRYFRDPEQTQRALARYAQLVGGKGEKAWSIAESKLDLYRQAAIAFDDDAEDGLRRSTHEGIFEHLRRWYGVGRNGRLWDASTAFDALISCQRASRGGSLTLLGLDDEGNQQAVIGCLERMRELKQIRSGAYPIMAVSKNLHFFNPKLFVIYDNDIVLKKVYRVFREDWNACYDGIIVRIPDDGITFYLAYLLWAGRMISSAYGSFMGDFADWFIAAVENERNDAASYRGELQSYFAAAFEFVVIGAAHLEADSGTCGM